MIHNEFRKPATINISDLARRYERPFLFDLEPFFAVDKLDLQNKTYFPRGCSKSLKYTHLEYPRFSNPYMENEIKGFVKHKVVDKHYSASYTKDLFVEFIQNWARFINTNNPELKSCTDMDYKQLYTEYTSWLKGRGITYIKQRKLAQVNVNMEWIQGPVKSIFILGFTQYYTYIKNIRFPDIRAEKDKDIWDVRKLGIPFETLPSRPRYTINYKHIEQSWLKESVKQYTYFRIQHKAMSSVLDDFKAINLFSQYLAEKCPKVKSWKNIDRMVMEGFISYVGSKGYVATTFNRRLSALKTFFTIGNILDIKDIPAKPLLFDTDFVKIIHKIPIPFSDNELKQMNDHIEDLPLIYGRIFFVLENIGMRLSDLCNTPIKINGRYCLQDQGNNKWLFIYYMPKVHRTNTVPIEPIVAKVIQSAIETSHETYGANCKYIFAKSPDAPIGQEDFVMNMNKMSKRNNLRTDTGKPLRIRGHTFRRTKATQYANMGVSSDIIRAMLGQRSLGVLKHYITIHSETMLKVMQPITDEANRMIENIGHEDTAVIQESKQNGMIPMPNGYCSKSVASGLCEHANACYSCRMFRPSKQFLDLYKRHLAETEQNIEVAKINHFDRLLEININLKAKLEKIINKLEE